MPYYDTCGCFIQVSFRQYQYSMTPLFSRYWTEITCESTDDHATERTPFSISYALPFGEGGTAAGGG